MLKKYLDKRIKGKIDGEVFDFNWDLGIFSELHLAKVGFLTRKIYKIKTQNDLNDYHIKRIKKYANSKYVKLTEEQKNFINRISQYEGKDWSDFRNLYSYDEIDADRKTIFKSSLIFSISALSLNAFEWMIIIAVLGLYLLVRSHI